MTRLLALIALVAVLQGCGLCAKKEPPPPQTYSAPAPLPPPPVTKRRGG